MVEGFAAYDFCACACQETLVPCWVAMVQYAGDSGVEHGVAEVFEAFVVGEPPVVLEW